jgi:hypothetical protein
MASITTFVKWLTHLSSERKFKEYKLLTGHDEAIAQAISRQFPTAAARVRVQIKGFVVDKVALGQISSEYFGFP